jgi:hypothetical protein
VTTLFVGILAISNPADAISLIGNSPSGGFGGLSRTINSNFQYAVGFTLPSGSDYTLNSITLRLANYQSGADTPLLQIYADSAKNSTDPNSAGVALQSVLFDKPNSSSNSGSPFTFNPQSTFTFLDDTRYWLLVDVTSGNFSWSQNPSGDANPTGISGITDIGYQGSDNNGGTYSANSTLSAFNIDVTEVATPVPFDFDPSFGVAVLGGGWLLRKHLKKKKSTKV